MLAKPEFRVPPQTKQVGAATQQYPFLVAGRGLKIVG
jgi:hypothetical protein